MKKKMEKLFVNLFIPSRYRLAQQQGLGLKHLQNIVSRFKKQVNITIDAISPNLGALQHHL